MAALLQAIFLLGLVQAGIRGFSILGIFYSLEIISLSIHILSNELFLKRQCHANFCIDFCL